MEVQKMEVQKMEVQKMEKHKALIIDDPDFNSNNVCIVTGSGSGIGRATAIAAAKNGLTVLGLDIDHRGNEETCNLVQNGQMTGCHTDLANDKEVRIAVEHAIAMGQIKYLINIAGIQHINPIENFSLKSYDKMQSIMLRAPFVLSKLCIPHMKESGGVIANMASIHAHIAAKNKAPYIMMKHGLIGLSKAISAEGEGKIRSFTVSTGFVSTPLAINQILAQATQKNITEKEVIEEVMLGKSQIKKMMSPEEVADLIIFGISRHGKYIVGGDILADGGMVNTY